MNDANKSPCGDGSTSGSGSGVPGVPGPSGTGTIAGNGNPAAAIRSVQVLIENWKRGYSVLERPEAFIDEVIK